MAPFVRGQMSRGGRGTLGLSTGALGTTAQAESSAVAPKTNPLRQSVRFTGAIGCSTSCLSCWLAPVRPL
jgi:hypothetical protein